MKKTKEMLRNKLSRSWLKKIRSHFILGLFITILSISLLIYSIFLTISIENIYYSIFFLIFLILGILYVLYGLQMFIPLIKINEKGLIFRRSGFISFLSQKFIPFEEISDIKIQEEERRLYSKPVVCIYTESHGVCKIDVKWVVNIDEIKNRIMSKI